MTDKDVRKYCSLTDKSLHEILFLQRLSVAKMYTVQMKIILMLSINCIVILSIH